MEVSFDRVQAMLTDRLGIALGGSTHGGQVAASRPEAIRLRGVLDGLDAQPLRVLVAGRGVGDEAMRAGAGDHLTRRGVDDREHPGLPGISRTDRLEDTDVAIADDTNVHCDAWEDLGMRRLDTPRDRSGGRLQARHHEVRSGPGDDDGRIARIDDRREGSERPHGRLGVSTGGPSTHPGQATFVDAGGSDIDIGWVHNGGARGGQWSRSGGHDGTAGTPIPGAG